MLELHKCILDRNVEPAPGMLLNYKLHLSYDNNHPEGFYDVFSIAITMYFNGEQSIILEDVSRNRGKALRIFHALADGEVDINTAPYIIEELLSQQEYL